MWIWQGFEGQLGLLFLKFLKFNNKSPLDTYHNPILKMRHLKSALDAKVRYQKEYVQNMQFGSAYEHAEHAKSGPSPRQAESQTELEKMQADIKES